MSEYKKYSFHFREHYYNDNHRNHFLDAEAFDVETAKEIALMGTRGGKKFEFIKDLTDYSIDDYIDYIIVYDRTGALLPTIEPRYIEAKRNINIKELLEDGN